MNMTRFQAVFQNMTDKNLTQLLVSDPYTIQYLTGYYLEPGERLYTLYLHINGTTKLFINDLFTPPETLEIEMVRFSDTDDSIALLMEVIQTNEVLGIDKNMAARFLLELMKRHAAADYCNGSLCIDEVRACKDAEEQQSMRQASLINDRAMARFRQEIHDGMTELEVAAVMKDIYLEEGAIGFSFSPLVGFGKNAAVGHYAPGDAVLQSGDCVLLDVGCQLADGYCADMTRTFFFQTVSEYQREVYNLVRKANETAESIIKPGVRFCDIDKAARDVIAEAGYGPQFTHRLGHSIGLEVHEFGDVSSANQEVVKEGMVFSIEPGVYLLEQFGVRIEDLVLVTKDGCEILNHYTKELQVID